VLVELTATPDLVVGVVEVCCGSEFGARDVRERVKPDTADYDEGAEDEPEEGAVD
jgi:hypothetical protein